MKNEKVRIDLPSSPPFEPPKPKKTLNHHPSSGKFRLVPRFLPKLEHFVQSVDWNSVEKCLVVKILETTHFEAFAWFGTINDRYAEGQKSSFVDFEQDSLKLYFLDDNENEVACFKFKNLKLIDHTCSLEKSTCNFPNPSGVDSPCNHVVHYITIVYADYKVVPIQVAETSAEIAISQNIDPQFAIDQEWLGSKEFVSSDEDT